MGWGMTRVEPVLAAADSLQRQGNTQQAEGLLRRALAARPDHPALLAGLGRLLARRGDHAGAEHTLRRALALDGTCTDALAGLGLLLLADDRPADAVTVLQDALSDAAADADLWHALGRALHDTGRLDEGWQALRRALALRPADADIHLSAGNLQRDRGDLDLALIHYRDSVRLAPGRAGGWYNLGLALLRRDDPAAARQALDRAIRLDPDQHAAWNALGSLHYAAADFTAAAAAFDRAATLAPDHAGTRWNQALLCLLRGDFAHGWPLYEWRRRTRFAPCAAYPQPEWQGGPLDGVRLLVHPEQGLGDMLMAARYVPRLAAAGAHVILRSPVGLAGPLSSLDGVGTLSREDEPLPPFDRHVPVMSLPGLFRAGIDPIPAATPYLRADPALVAHWRTRIDGLVPAGTALRAGLVWAGNPAFPGDRRRSPGLDALSPLLAAPGVRWFSVQMGPGRQAALAQGMPPGLIDLGPEIRDFADTAAILAVLDLLVSSCTAPAHMAGALGRPVWIILSRVPDWRWGLDRTDSPWYPTARLYRQTIAGDWSGPVAGMLRDLVTLRPVMAKPAG